MLFALEREKKSPTQPLPTKYKTLTMTNYYVKIYIYFDMPIDRFKTV